MTLKRVKEKSCLEMKIQSTTAGVMTDEMKMNGLCFFFLEFFFL